MAETKYPYSISEDFPNEAVNPDRLTEEVGDSAIVTALSYINTGGDDCDIWFADALSGGDETILDGIVAAHSGLPLPVLRQVLFQGGDFSANLGDYALLNCPDDGTAYLSFMVPFDFIALKSIHLIVATPVAFTDKVIKIYSDYGNVGESPVTHSESNTTKTYSAPANQWGALDVSSVFSSLTANDVCGLKIKPVAVGTDFKSIGLRMIYEV